MAKGAIIARIISEYSDKGSKAAAKDMEKLGKGFNEFGDKVGKAFAVAGGAAATFAIAMGVDAVKAAMAEQASQAVLVNTLKNTTNANEEAIASVDKYIKATMLRLNVQDDLLRPSLQSLVMATHDITKAEALQQVALDVSASRGKDLGEVSVALSKAYVGNFNALKRLGIPLNEALVKSKDFTGIVKELAAATGGSAAAAADTFAGRLGRIKLAFDDVKKTIGNAIITALQPFLDKFVAALPQIEDWLNRNGEKIAGFFKTGITYGVAFGKLLAQIFTFVAKHIKVFEEIGAVIVAALFGAKVAAAAEGMVTAIMAIIKVVKALRTVSLGAAAAEALATGGISAAAGAAAFTVALVASNVAMNKFNKDADKAGNGVGDLKFDFKGLAGGVGDFTKGLTGANGGLGTNNKLTREQIQLADTLAKLKKMGITTTSTDPNELEAARLNLVKQGNLAELDRLAKYKESLDLMNKNTEAAMRYSDILGVIADHNVSTEEVAVLATKWGMSAGQVEEYIAQIYAANSTPADNAAIVALYESWGLTNSQALQYIDFAHALNDQKLSDTEINNLRDKWNLTRQQVLDYADAVTNGTVIDLGKIASPGDTAKKSWDDALASLNKYLAVLPTGSVPVTSENLGGYTGNVPGGGIPSPGLGAFQAPYMPTTDIGSGTSGFGNSYTGSSARAGEMNVTVHVAGSVVTQQDLTNSIRNSLLNGQLSGIGISARASDL